MKTRSTAIAQKLMNLYRNAFAIDGGWAAVNRVLVDESDDAVIGEMLKMPCGRYLSEHIRNLKGGVTPMDSIDAELIPYNGMIARAPDPEFAAKDYEALSMALENFQPDKERLEHIKSLPIVKRFGGHWASGVRNILQGDALLAIWQTVLQTDSALRLWDRAADLLSSTPSDLLRAEVQADMPEYETYLPMFGKDGIAALNRLRQLLV